MKVDLLVYSRGDIQLRRKEWSGGNPCVQQ
jgi:hypothetical protein